MPIAKLVSSYLTMPKAAYIILCASIGALGAVFLLQYGFKVQPCVLCLWQRVPFGVCVFLSLAALMWIPYGQRTRLLLALCALAFFINSGVAIFHTGVERQWWLGTSGCSIKPLQGASVESLREELLGTVVARCDQITWSLFGLSLANYNVLLSFVLGIFSVAAAIKKRKFF